MKTSPQVFYSTINLLPLGVFFLDQSEIIREWNDWMVNRTHIKSADAIGKKLPDLFPNFNHPRFSWALDMVLSSSCPQLLSQVLNKYVIPIPLKLASHYGLTMMQQKVQISPLTLDNGEVVALVTVVDVTENALQESALLEAATLLQEHSFRDDLTDLYNRRFLLAWLKKEFSNASRHSYAITCLMLDLDLFKLINDKCGHDIGDQVLRDFSKILLNHVRESDVCVRYGGEEFMIILTHSNLADAITRAESLTDTVRKTSIGGLAPGAVTCSIGVSIYSADNPCTQDELLKQADKQLYKAKQTGRDRVC